MRIAYELVLEKSKTVLNLTTQKALSEEGDFGISVFYTKNSAVVSLNTLNQSVVNLLGFLAREDQVDIYDWDSLCEFLLSNKKSCKQVVWDPAMRKFRNCSTMSDAANLYEAKGLSDFVVEAETETTAVNTITRNVQKEMIDNPERATELAEWIAAGRPIVEKASGKAPKFTSLEEVRVEPATKESDSE
jgi:hypothetical protein